MKMLMSKHKRKKQLEHKRKKFKDDLRKIMNPAVAMAIIKTFTASKHRRHIYSVWYMLRNHKEAKKEYDDNLLGEHLCGRDEIFHTMHFIAPEIKIEITESLALGDAFSVAKTFLKKHLDTRKKGE